MYEVIRWVSLVALWLCIALNVWVTAKNFRLSKRLNAERKYCLIMIDTCVEFLEAELKKENSES